MKTRCTLHVLSEDEMDRIHALSLQILEGIGVKITHERPFGCLRMAVVTSMRIRGG